MDGQFTVMWKTLRRPVKRMPKQTVAHTNSDNRKQPNEPRKTYFSEGS